MKKIIPFIVVLLFIGFVILGYKAASNLFTKNSKNDPSENSNTATALTQKNYLLILVNELSADDPQLIAVWSLLEYPSSAPQLLFLPLFPATDDEINQGVESGFSLTKDKLLSTREYKRLKSTYDLQVDGYFITDNTGFLHMASILGIESIEIFTQSAQTTEENMAIQNSGKTVFSSLCQLFTSGASNSFFSQLNWSTLLPDHFSTNLSFEELTLMIDNINASPSLDQCQVLLNQ